MGYGKGLGHNQNLDILSQQLNYQTQYNQMSYQHYLQQVQAYGGLNKKVQDQQDLQFLSAVQWQQQHQEVRYSLDSQPLSFGKTVTQNPNVHQFSKCCPICKMFTYLQNNFDPFSTFKPIFKTLGHFRNVDV